MAWAPRPWTAAHGPGARATVPYRRMLPAACCLLILLAGCANSRQQRIIDRAVADYFAGNYAQARETLRPLAEEPNENFVLNNLRLGSAALVDYDLQEAEAAFLRAYEVLNAVGVDGGGRTLGAVLVDERLRVWRGEPYERAMANFYLGLIYYMRQDYLNARGAFENALFRLRDYGPGGDKEDEYREVESNFILGHLMLAKAWQRIGREDLAQANFERVTQLRPELRYLADYQANEESNLLLVIDYGYAPRKVTDFDGSIVGFYPSPAEAGPIPTPRVLVDGQNVLTPAIARAPLDLVTLAQDRRWQSLDTLRLVRSAVGTGLIVAGAHQATRTRTVRTPQGYVTRHEPRYGEAAALIAAGLLLKATSQADVRQWEMLPRTTFILPLRVPPGERDITIDIPGFGGMRQTWHGLYVPDHGEATYYFRMQRWQHGQYHWGRR
jgi:hypothetical protein